VGVDCSLDALISMCQLVYTTKYMLSAEQALKFDVLADGIKITPEAETAWQDTFEGPMSLNEYASTSGICLKIEDGKDGVWLNAPYSQEFAQQATASLRYAGGFLVAQAGTEFPATIIPVPAYHGQTYTDNGKEYPYTNLGVTHTDRVRISPIEGCGMVCRFCNIPYELKYRQKPEEELLRVIEIAKDDEQAPARHVLISGGTPKIEDEPWEDAIYESVIANSPLPVDIMMTPREDPSYLRRLGAAGVNALSINIEVFDSQRARRLIPTKNRRFGPQGYLDYIEKAVDEIGIGRVQSLILFGEAIEPVESTLAGVQALVDRGCIPVLSPFRPDPRTPMEHDSPTTVAEMKQVYQKTVEICEQADNGIKPGPRCVPCHHNTATFSDGSDFYIPLDKDITSRLHVT
jgi:hypothetical protein